MRIRRISIFERIFHNEKEDYELTLIAYGTKEEMQKLQKDIIAQSS